MRTHDKSVLELLNMLETRCAHAAVALREAHEISVQVIMDLPGVDDPARDDVMDRVTKAAMQASAALQATDAVWNLARAARRKWAT